MSPGPAGARPCGARPAMVERHRLGRICQSPEDWLSGLREFSDDGLLRASIARRGLEVVARHYGMDVIARKYLAVYEDLMGVGGRMAR